MIRLSDPCVLKLAVGFFFAMVIEIRKLIVLVFPCFIN